jgi:hypothetical protein
MRYNALFTDLINDLTESVPSVDFYVDSEDWPGMTLREKQALQLKQSFYKKLVDQTATVADDVALDKFLTSNQKCGAWDLKPESSSDELLIGQFSYELYNAVHHRGHSVVPDFSTICTRGRTGPGASLGANGNDFYTKLFSSPLTCTSEGLFTVYRSHIEYDATWDAAERQRADQFDNHTVVSGNRLSFVPKNADTSRVICTEPNINMFLQLGLGELINDVLRRKFRIDLSNQQVYNRELARIGSAQNSLCTIDLSSASDTVSLKMLERLAPRNFVLWLKALRSPSCQLPDGSWERLDMVSSMGNGFTFSLETLIFTCVVAAVYRIEDIKMRQTTCSVTRNSKQASATEVWEHGNFGVFGDDIIVEKSTYRKVCRLLTLLGFEVNSSKSFFEGPFRESCGGDFFEGHFCRGIYIKTLATPASRYVAINRLNEWTALTGIPLRRTLKRLMKSVRFLPVPFHENDDAGVKVPFEYAWTSTAKHGLTDKPELFGAIGYTAWSAYPTTLRIKDGIIAKPKSVKGRIYNPNGLLLAFLRGDIKECTLSIRHGSARYTTKRCVTPNWDYVPTVGKQFPIGLGRLASAVISNIY